MSLNKNLNLFFEKYNYYIIGLILIFAFFLRILYLNYDSMWIDETLSAVSAKAILEQGYPILDSGASYERSLLFHYVMAFFMLIFGANDFGARFISVIFGVLTVYLGYLYGRKFIGGNFAPYAFAILLAVSSLEIIYSKQARFYQGFQFFYFLSFYLFYKFIILKERFFKKRYQDLLSLLISTLLAMHLQFMGYIIVPLFILIYLINNFDFKKKFNLLKNKYFWIISIIGIIFMLYIIFRLSGKLNSINSLRYLVYANAYIDYVFKYWIVFAFFILGFIVSLYKNFRFNFSFFLYFAIPFFGIFFIQTFGSRYVYFALFGLLFYVAYLFEKLHLKLVIFILFLIFYSGTLFDFNGIKEPLYDSSMPLADYKGAYTFVVNQNYTTPLVTTWSPGALWYGKGADYLIYYSISGLPGSFLINNQTGRSTFTNSSIIYNSSQIPTEYIFVLDEQANRKIKPSFLREILSNCTTSYNSYNIKVFDCVK